MIAVSHTAVFTVKYINSTSVLNMDKSKGAQMLMLMLFSWVHVWTCIVLIRLYVNSRVQRIRFESQIRLYTDIVCYIPQNILIYDNKTTKEREYITWQKLLHKQQQQPYILTGLKKCWRSTRARVERTMMVVHIVSRAQHPAVNMNQSPQPMFCLSLTQPGCLDQQPGGD